MRVKALFFDRAKVIKAVARGRRIALNRIGAFIRLTSKRSIRKVSKKARKRGDATSPPGKPPYSHTGRLRDNIFYSYDPAPDSVVIGPALLTQRNADAKPVSGTVPQVLERGGQVAMKDRSGKTKIVTIAPRPFMGPALDKAVAQNALAKAWKDVVK